MAKKYVPKKDYTINKRIDHIDRIRTAYIMCEDLPIATISEEYSSLSGEFDWVIKPIWENWDKLTKRGVLVSIAGIDETLHKDEYIRRYVPYFVTQRTIPEGRRDLFPMLEKIGLTYNDLFEVLCRTHGVCANDCNYVSRTPDIIIDPRKPYKYDIPDWDTSKDGWLK